MTMRTREVGTNPEVVRMKLLSGFQVSVGRRTIGEDAWRLRKAKAIVKLLALSPGHRLHRERVMELLWPDSNRRSAYNNLRQALHAARKALDPASGSRYLASREEQLVLCPSGELWVDVEAFEEAATTARRSQDVAAYRAALELYSGELLPDDRYEEWVEDRREQLRQLHLALLVELARLYEEREEYEPAIEALRRVISEEPTLEEAHTALMRHYAFTDRPEQALVQYERLRDALSRELGTKPTATTRRLRGEIAAGTLPQRPPAGSVQEEERAGSDRHNLLASLTSFVGRERDMLEIKRLLSMTRLLTLTGTGGSGKTRLALEVARDLVGVYPDGAWVVELVGLSEETLLPQAVARALEVHEQPGYSFTDTLVGALKKKNMLLVLDNSEHVLDPTARLVNKLLISCPLLRILATSRESLGVAGEVNWLVSPLSVPDENHSPTAEELMRYEAVRLFVERARLRLPAFELTNANAKTVAEVCRRLEGIPLAIELATARMSVLTVEQVAEKLEDSLKLLTGGARTAVPRQQTMRATLEWSYDLLSEPERKLFGRLSVFAGGWTLEAAEAVGSGEGLEEYEILDLLGRLVDKSLIISDAPLEEGALRYRMLEPVRQYARERLEASGEAKATLNRHALWFLELAEQAEQELGGPNQALWFDRLEAEHDNLRAVLRRRLDSKGAELGLRLAGALWLFWYTRGYLSEGRQWLETAVSAGSTRALHLKARALHGAGYMVARQGDLVAAKEFLEEALALFRELEDNEGVASALTLLGIVTVLRQELEAVPALYEEAMNLEPEIQDRRTLAYLRQFSGIVAVGQENWERADALHEESLELFREVRDVAGINASLTNLGLSALAQAEYPRASALFRENLSVVPESDKTSIMYNLLGLACAESARGQSVRAALLWGAAQAIREAFDIQIMPLARSRISYDEHLSTARSQLGDAGFESAWAEGKAMTFHEVIEYAFGAEVPTSQAASVTRVSPKASTDEPLTPREREIASLAARGLTTNRQISAELFISERTVESHVRNILEKLRLQSRAQLAAWTTEQRLFDDVRS